MSRVPSLKDILDDIQDEVSDSDEGEFEEIVPQVVQKKSLLDIPDEYRVLNKPTIPIQENGYYEKQSNYNRKPNIIPLTEANLMKASGGSMISYDIPKYDLMESRSIKSKKSHKSEYSERSERSHKSIKSHKSSVSSIEFSVGEDNPNRVISYEDDDRRSEISSLSAGSIKSQKMNNYDKPMIKNRVKEYDNESIVSKISKKSHISVSSISSLGSKSSIQSKSSIKSEKPLIQSLYPKKMEDVHAFNKFSNQNKDGEGEKAKVDIKRIKNIEDFKIRINNYIKLDDEINALMEGLRERKKEKKMYEDELLNFMKENDIDSIKSKQDNSQIELIQRKKSETLSKEYLTNCLMELIKNKSTSDNIVNFIYNNRNMVEINKIKRVKEGKNKKKKDKY
jgi:hypothetical protein